MYAKKIRQYERCIYLLDFACKVAKLIENARHNLHLYDHTQNQSHPVKLFNCREDLVAKLDRFKRLHKRIMLWHVDAVLASIAEYIPLDVYDESNETAVSIAERKFLLTA